jgi:hypothetical protein
MLQQVVHPDPADAKSNIIDYLRTPSAACQLMIDGSLTGYVPVYKNKAPARTAIQ